jgi:hypothetical protein
MARQERFTARLVCPNCRTMGEAVCEENENPALADKRDRLIVSVTKGFELGGYLNGNQQVICSRCHSLIPI